MVKRKHIMTAGLILIIGLFIFYLFYENEEAKVKRQFNILSKRISKESVESKLMAAATAKKTLKLAAQTIELKVPSHSFSKTFQRRDLPALIFNFRSRHSSIALRFIDFAVDFTDDDTAKVNVTANLTGELETGEAVYETRELNCILKKLENKEWLFSSIEIVEVLEK